MPGEPLGVTRPVTSYLDTFSLAPPPPPSSVSLFSFVLRALFVASSRLVVRKVHLPASIKGNPACFSVSLSRLVSSHVVSSSPPHLLFLSPRFSSPRAFLRADFFGFLSVGNLPSSFSSCARNRIDMRSTRNFFIPSSLLSALRARNSMEKREKREKKKNADERRTRTVRERSLHRSRGRFCRCNEDPRGQIYDTASCNSRLRRRSILRHLGI